MYVDTYKYIYCMCMIECNLYKMPHCIKYHLCKCAFTTQVVKDQSIKIAGSVDILGNPTGLMSDIASGVSGMFSQNPDILGFVRDVSHGIFDSTSKVSMWFIAC